MWGGGLQKKMWQTTEIGLSVISSGPHPLRTLQWPSNEYHQAARYSEKCTNKKSEVQILTPAITSSEIQSILLPLCDSNYS